MLTSTRLSVNGTIGTPCERVAAPPAGPCLAAGGDQGGELFGRFVFVFQSNEILVAELESVKQKLARTHAYLGSPGSNPVLALAHLRQLKARRSAALTMLRANRIQARALIARTKTGDEADVA